MSVFSVPVTIGVNEEEIARNIEKNVEKKVIEAIIKEVKGVMYTKVSYFGNDDPLREMILAEIDKILKEKEDIIVKIAADKLADRLSRQKAVKEKAANVAREVYE